jgi:hypothetical protein
LTKIFIAIIAGYGIDFVFKKTNKETLAHIKAFSNGADDERHDHESVIEEQACCGHSASSSSKEFDSKEIFLHPIIHTVKIFVFIFIITLIINGAIFWMGEEALAGFFLAHRIMQPFAAALIGLIPSCAASVVIAELYLKGTIAYGSFVAGLCASGGLGILILFKEEKNKKNILKVIALLFGVSVAAGLIFNIF